MRLDPEIQSIILRVAYEQDVDPSLIEALIFRESSGRPRATSPKGAMGLMQLMPGTAEELGVQDPYDPSQNVEGGVKYLSQLLREFESPQKALTAYHAGPSRVRKGRVPRSSKRHALKVLAHQLMLNERKAYPSYGTKGVLP